MHLKQTNKYKNIKINKYNNYSDKNKWNKAIILISISSHKLARIAKLPNLTLFSYHHLFYMDTL